ncbi:hypothetical protein QC762_704820 [Podospora pseudocomata]|uniref:Carboxylic ester hydrolase n=1 Tax=Podospora pseudocomata TaxID=2093779 RepID=A0ABR0G2A1_9PEZI|nr:hypothetical protein QC762_704820 [Podospora pseudocomata]
MAIKQWMGLLLAGSSLSSALPSSKVAARTTDAATEFVDNLVAELTAAYNDHQIRAPQCAQESTLVVDTGYAKYRGYYDSASALNHWKGIRYSQAPTGSLRWQPPRFPALAPSAPVTDADAFGNTCYQHTPRTALGSFLGPPGSEDCLFLNVVAPANATKLPVVVWIHGGGYGYGDSSQDLTQLINDNGKTFIGVSINYRLGAFGYLSSQEVKDNGVVNAGHLDQALALAWVKLHICKFGGDPSKVTIAGQSAGAGSVMHHALAVNGDLGSLLFDKGLAQSPYLPYQPNFNDAIPTSRYYAFSAAAGCPSSGSVFSCLLSKSAADLELASLSVTASSTQGSWGFWPVTDGVYIKNRPTAQLTAKRVNGNKLLVGYNAHEGPLFVPGPDAIETQADLLAWMALWFPNLTSAQLNSILAINPNSALSSASGPRFETDGLNTGGFNAINTSPDGVGQKQRGNNIYAEATFACPAYWLADAYSGNPGKSSWLYQFSVPFAYHGADINAAFGPSTSSLPSDITLAFRKAWGNFIVGGNPSIANTIANGASSASPSAYHPASNWPVWNQNAPQFVNFNTTGGTLATVELPLVGSYPQYEGPGIKNAISVQNANTWEAYRGDRCAFYKNLGPYMPN